MEKETIDGVQKICPVITPEAWNWIFERQYDEDRLSAVERNAINELMDYMDKLRGDEKRYQAFRNHQQLKRVKNMKRNMWVYKGKSKSE